MSKKVVASFLSSACYWLLIYSSPSKCGFFTVVVALVNIGLIFLFHLAFCCSISNRRYSLLSFNSVKNFQIRRQMTPIRSTPPMVPPTMVNTLGASGHSLFKVYFMVYCSSPSFSCNTYCIQQLSESFSLQNASSDSCSTFSAVTPGQACVQFLELCSPCFI